MNQFLIDDLCEVSYRFAQVCYENDYNCCQLMLTKYCVVPLLDGDIPVSGFVLQVQAAVNDTIDFMRS